jgi:mycothiol synthase
VTTEALTRVDPSDFSTRLDMIVALDAAARAADGHDSLGDSVWRDLAHPQPDSAGFLSGAHAYLHVMRDGAGPKWTAGIVRLPTARGIEVVVALLDSARTYVEANGGRSLECWVFGASAADDDAFGAAGFRAARSLYEMRAPLPLSDPVPWPAGIEVRTFEPGRDNADWLRVNNRAFASHTDQGGWTEAILEMRMAEPWFDPKLFLLASDPAGLAGFNWLKQHPARSPDPALGEIYVIGVDPRAQGTGLGRALALNGLRMVHAAGAGAALLFCAADNVGALALYRSIGFSVHRTDRAYTRDLDAAPTTR